MSKILVYADPHWCRSSSIMRGYDGDTTIRLKNLIQSLQWVEETAKEKSCDVILCLGDFFDRANLDAEEITALKNLKFNPDILHWFLVGNHDSYNIDNSVNVANVFELIDGASGKNNITVFSRPTTLNNGSSTLCMLPYTRDTKTFDIESLFGSWDGVMPRYIFSHNDLMGVSYGGFVTDFGIPVQVLSKSCTQCFNGHIHNRGEYDNVLNVGNLTGLNFSEDGNKYQHIAIVLNTQTGEAEELVNPYAIKFVKIDTTKGNHRTSIPDNSVVSIVCYSDEVADVKDILAEKNVVSYRISARERETSVKDNKDISELLKQDHLKAFYNYVTENIGSDYITIEEAQKVIGG